MTEKNKYVADGTLNSGGSKSPIDKQKGNGAKTKMRCFQFCEVLVLTPVMLVIVGLFTIPTVFHALPSEIVRIVAWLCLLFAGWLLFTAHTLVRVWATKYSSTPYNSQNCELGVE